MSVTKNEKLLWTDVKTIYSNLNTAPHTEGGKSYGGRRNFGFSDVTLTTDTTIDAARLNALNSFIKEMASNGFISSIAKGVTNVSKGQKAEPSFLATLSSQIDQINKVCAFNATCFGSCFQDFFCFYCDSWHSSCFEDNDSCFGACWGQCFSDSGFLSCFGFSGGLASCFDTGFTCAEQSPCGASDCFGATN